MTSEKLQPKQPIVLHLRECNFCDWRGCESQCVHPKHLPEQLLCPICNETTHVVVAMAT